MPESPRPAPHPETPTERRLRWIAGVVLAIGILNFLSFAVMGLILGGSTDWGMPESGPYLLNSHGKETEVTRDQYAYLMWHSRIVFAGHFFTIVAGVIFAGLMQQREAYARHQRAGRDAWRERSEAQATPPE